ncbi:class IV adenylate cyclase [Nocardia fusca]|uniref:class IV adenylate cyclase n=1 Tax=Nocardia fusca TaxID=941183 RepID=UPI0007A74993|nr:class IV adenylate cyclase [Nocardia fusca]
MASRVIEAEYKARLTDPDSVRAKLAGLAAAEVVTYHDAYFDDGARSLHAGDRELRLRTVRGSGSVRHLLTFKEAAVDLETGSKPEYETDIGGREVLEQILYRLGYRPSISFTKECENYRFMTNGRNVLATVVTVPEIDGTFLELETLVDADEDLDSALSDLRKSLSALGVSDDHLTTELYTDAVAESRGGEGH